MKNILLISVIIVVAVIVPFHSGAAAEFYINGLPESDSVIFASDARLEFIEGTTNSIVGVISFDPASTSSPTSGRIRVDAASLKTGIELRDEHMRERHLHTEQFPYIEFTLKSVSGLPPSLSPSVTTNLNLSGDFTVHGKTLPISAPATAELLSGSGSVHQAILVTASFEIKLDDYDIPRPKMLLLKLAETIKIRVRFIASTSNQSVTF